jgi:hypothetical protein
VNVLEVDNRAVFSSDPLWDVELGVDPAEVLMRFIASVASRRDVVDAGAAMIRNIFDGASKSLHTPTNL